MPGGDNYADRGGANVQSLPQSVSVVSARQIADTPAQELDDVLRLVPGIDLMGYAGEAQHPTSASIGMRGLGGGTSGISRALVMVDGVPLNDAFFGYIPWGRIPLENIERVEVVRGGGSPLWGNYAEGGGINVITREPDPHAAGFELGAGSYSTYRASAFDNFEPVASHRLQAFGAVNGTGGFDQVPGYERTPFNTPTSYQAVNLLLKDTFNPSADLSAHVSANYHDNHQQLETVLDRNSQRTYSLSADVTQRFADEARLTATAFGSYSQFQTNNSTYFPNQSDLAATTQTLNEIHAIGAHDVGGSLIWSQDLSGPITSWMIGADIRSISGVDNTQHFVAPDFSAEATSTFSRGEQTFVGGFGQVSVKPASALLLTASGRYQSVQNNSGFDGSIGGAGAVPDRNHTSFDPRLDIRYALGDGLALRGAYYQSFRAPNISDEFYTYAAGGFVMVPAPFLQPEKLHGAEFGFDYVTTSLRSQFTVYRTEVDNYIVAEPTTNPVFSPAGWYVVQNQNIAAVRAQGFEAEIAWDLGGGTLANLAYTYADSVVQSNPLDPASIGQQIVDVPKNRLGGGLSWRGSEGWRLAVQAYWVDRTAWASADHTDPGYPGKISADAHFLADVTGSYPITPSLTAYLKIQNLFDRHYITTSYSAPSAQVSGAPFEAFGGIRFAMP